MKKVMMFFLAFTYSLGILAQNQGMGNGHGDFNGNSSFSTTEILLGAILFILIIVLLMRSFNNSRNGK